MQFSTLLGHVCFTAIILGISAVSDDSDPLLGTISTRQLVIEKLHEQNTSASVSTYTGRGALQQLTLSQRAVLQLGVHRLRARVRFEVTDNGM